MSNAVSAAHSIIDTHDGAERGAIARTLSVFGRKAIEFAARGGVRIRLLAPRERYCAVSAALCRIGVDVDSWPAPPAGLFVVEERTIYLRSRSAMTVAHEFGHALDCALGGGVYFSSVDPELRKLFTQATSFVTPYAASGIDEYFAEALRAFVEVNDPASHWPRATKARLRSVDRALYAYVDRLFRMSFTRAA